MMFAHDTPLEVITFHSADFNVPELAKTITKLRATASRSPQPVTVEQLEAIGTSDTSVLLLQVARDGADLQVVGMVYFGISYLEDRATLGPICVDKESTPRGHGTPLMEFGIQYIKDNYPTLRRIDLTNRLDHDLSAWYEKFGFLARTEKTGDPSTIFRLSLE